MNTYLVSGTIHWAEYCDCPHCSGHWNDRKVENQVVMDETEEDALDRAIVEVLAKENFDEAEWQKGVKVQVVSENSDEGDYLLPSPPEKLVKRAQEVGLASYWLAAKLVQP